MRYLMCCYASPGVLTLVYLTPSNTKSCIRALTNSMLVCGMTHYANNDNGIGPTYLASLSSLPFQPTCHLFLLTSPSCNDSMQTPVAVGGCGCVLSTEFTHRQASQQAKLQIWRCGEQQAWRLLQGAREGALWAAMSPQTDARSRMPREFGTHKLTKQATLSYLDNYDHVLNFLATLNVNLLHDHEQHARSRRYAGDPWAPDDLADIQWQQHCSSTGGAGRGRGRGRGKWHGENKRKKGSSRKKHWVCN